MEVVKELQLCILLPLKLRIKGQLIQQQNEDPEFVDLYWYFQDSDGAGSLSVVMFEK